MALILGLQGVSACSLSSDISGSSGWAPGSPSNKDLEKWSGTTAPGCREVRESDSTYQRALVLLGLSHLGTTWTLKLLSL